MKIIIQIALSFVMLGMTSLVSARNIDAETKKILQKLSDYYNKNAPIQIDKYTSLYGANVVGSKMLSMNFVIDSGGEFNVFDPEIKQGLNELVVNSTCTNPDKLKFMHLLGASYVHNYYTSKGIYVSKILVNFDTCKKLANR